MTTIAINNTTDHTPPFDIRDWIKKIAANLNLTINHIELTLLTKDDIQTLNHTHFNNDCPTDTISFNLESAISTQFYFKIPNETSNLMKID